MTAEMHSGFMDVRKALSITSPRAPTPSLDDEAQAQIARIVAIWEGALARYGKAGGFLFGAFSIADRFYAPVVTRFEAYRIGLPAAAQAYTQRILALNPCAVGSGGSDGFGGVRPDVRGLPRARFTGRAAFCTGALSAVSVK